MAIQVQAEQPANQVQEATIVGQAQQLSQVSTQGSAVSAVTELEGHMSKKR